MSAFTRTQVISIIYLILECTLAIHSLSSFRTASYSTKTPYFWLNDEKEIVADDSESWFDYGEKTCQVIHLNAVLRHGARYPSLKWIKRMSALHQKLIQNGVDERFPFMKSWKNPFPEESDKIIAELGQQEQELLGERFARKFNLLFDEDMDTVRIMTSSKQRSYASSLAFFSGLSQTVLGEADKEMEPTIDDIAMRFHDNCVHFSETVDDNKTATSEYSKFKYGPEVAFCTKKLSKVLGVPNEEDVTPDDLNTIHQLCAFEEALTETGSQWCQFLDQENLEIIQYMNDLKQYWKKMYGHDISSAMSCPLVSGIFTTLDKVIQANDDDDDYEAAVFGFGHAETLAPLYAALGLFKDDPQLKADNFQIHSDRKFRASRVLPFSGNFALALFQCDSVDSSKVASDDSEYVVKFYVNEKPVDIPACGKKVCRYDIVRDFYKGQVDHCEFHKMCRNPEPEKDSPKHEEL